MNFRYDINGLRAIAVLAVVLFHFNPQWLPGGFAGVDVFFVISGFLMTSIIFSGVEKNTFNLFKFYNARANRIVPVLAAMSAVLLVFGWFYLLPTDYRDLGRQVEKSSLFISNLLFAKGGGYFDTAEHTKWLLHTWSLSVEWQFYIFFPIIIIALKKFLSFRNLKLIVLGLFLASFIYCIYATHKDSKTAYFLLTSRAWEMLLGGLAFLYPWSLKNKSHQIVTQCLGIVLIIASYFLMSKDTPWPGYMALIPVFGAYLIVVANYQNNFLINNPISNSIGKWSYSIYVWHWPLVVLGFYFAFENWWIYGIPLSILLGFLSYQFIEKINFPRYSSWKEIYKVKPFYIFLIILACGYAIKEMDGMEIQKYGRLSQVSEKTTFLNDYEKQHQKLPARRGALPPRRMRGEQNRTARRACSGHHGRHARRRTRHRRPGGHRIPDRRSARRRPTDRLRGCRMAPPARRGSRHGDLSGRRLHRRGAPHRDRDAELSRGRRRDRDEHAAGRPAAPVHGCGQPGADDLGRWRSAAAGWRRGDLGASSSPRHGRVTDPRYAGRREVSLSPPCGIFGGSEAAW